MYKCYIFNMLSFIFGLWFSFCSVIIKHYFGYFVLISRLCFVRAVICPVSPWENGTIGVMFWSQVFLLSKCLIGVVLVVFNFIKVFFFCFSLFSWFCFSFLWLPKCWFWLLLSFWQVFVSLAASCILLTLRGFSSSSSCSHCFALL